MNGERASCEHARSSGILYGEKGRGGKEGSWFDEEAEEILTACSLLFTWYFSRYYTTCMDVVSYWLGHCNRQPPTNRSDTQPWRHGDEVVR